METKSVIFDLDGCLFDDSHRKTYLSQAENSQKDWDTYHAYLKLDEQIPHAVQLLSSFLRNGLYIVFITGRPVKYQQETVEKLKKLVDGIKEEFSINAHWRLIMRGDDDKSTSPQMKAAALDLQGYGPHNIAAAYDDRPDILDMYTSRGINAYCLSLKHDGKTPWGKSQDEPLPKDKTPKVPSEAKKVNPNIAQAASLEPVADLMERHAATFRERYEEYGNNAEVVGRIMAAMFPNGVQLKTAKDFEIWHLFELMIVKLSRFSSSGLRHEDSINDLPAYCGMVHRLINDHNITFLEGNESE